MLINVAMPILATLDVSAIGAERRLNAVGNVAAAPV